MSPASHTVNQSNTAKEALSKARDVLVMLPQNPSMDVIAAGLAVYSAINSKDKNVMIACPTKIEVQNPPLAEVGHITDKIGNRNLVIALQVTSRESIDKVSYNLDESAKIFNLVIQPKKGYPPLKSNDITYSYAGVQADVVILVGVQRLEDLSVFYQEEAKLFTETTTIALHRQPISKYAAHEYINTKLTSVSEVAFQWLKELGVNIGEVAATALIYGLEATTHQLQDTAVTPETLEAVAALMRYGGKRLSSTTSTAQQAPSNQVSKMPVGFMNHTNVTRMPTAQ